MLNYDDLDLKYDLCSQIIQCFDHENIESITRNLNIFSVCTKDIDDNGCYTVFCARSMDVIFDILIDPPNMIDIAVTCTGEDTAFYVHGTTGYKDIWFETSYEFESDLFALSTTLSTEALNELYIINKLNKNLSLFGISFNQNTLSILQRKIQELK